MTDHDPHLVLRVYADGDGLDAYPSDPQEAGVKGKDNLDRWVYILAATISEVVGKICADRQSALTLVRRVQLELDEVLVAVQVEYDQLFPESAADALSIEEFKQRIAAENPSDPA
jgi:hypothetical protein